MKKTTLNQIGSDGVLSLNGDVVKKIYNQLLQKDSYKLLTEFREQMGYEDNQEGLFGGGLKDFLSDLMTTNRVKNDRTPPGFQWQDDLEDFYKKNRRSLLELFVSEANEEMLFHVYPDLKHYSFTSAKDVIEIANMGHEILSILALKIFAHYICEMEIEIQD